MLKLIKIIHEQLETEYPSYLIDIGAKDDNLICSLPAILITPIKEHSTINMLGNRKTSSIDLEITLHEYHIPSQLIEEIELIDKVKHFILNNETIKFQIVNIDSVSTSYKILKDSVNDLNGTIALSLQLRINLK